METDRSLRWQDVLDANPGAIDGQFNPERKALLAPGVYVDLSVLTAAGWLSEFRAKMKEAGIPTYFGAPELEGLASEPEGLEPVRATVVEIPVETVQSCVDGKILVEIDGVRGHINASVFYNCIGKPILVDCFNGAGRLSLIGNGTALPTRGEGSHSNFDASNRWD